MWSKLQSKIIERQQADLLRQRLLVESPQQVELQSSGKQYLNFSSNDYLGLANHPKMVEAMTVAAQKFGVGSGASHLIVGHSSEHHALEEELAGFCGQERALLFSTGFMANQGILTGLFDSNDLIIQDKLNHASLIDGGQLSAAKSVRYAHNDMQALQRRLQARNSESINSQQKVVVTDGVFSMDGDCAPLDEITALCQQNDAALMVDDAHGFGVLGKNGKGTLEQFNLAPADASIYMATLGKALGGFGAFVAADEVVIEGLIQFARSYIYTTAMPPAVAAANRMGLKLVQQEAWRRDELANNISYFKQLAAHENLQLMPSNSPIQPLWVGESSKAVALSRQLKVKNIMLGAIRPPTVPEGGARLRITLTAEHNQQQIEQLVEAIELATKQLEA